jgi:hypothetical protein
MPTERQLLIVAIACFAAGIIIVLALGALAW